MNYQKLLLGLLIYKDLMKKTNKAFTLLEILVVISILGILIALGTAAFSTAQKKSRDARRQGDMKAIQKGFEQLYAKNTAYPTTAELDTLDTDIFPAGLPDDPKNSGDNVYTVNTDTDGYCVCAYLESGTGNSADLPDVATSTTCQFGSGDYQCVTNLQ